jgi:hypothetical protein
MEKRLRILGLIALTWLFLFSQNSLFSQKLKIEDIPDDIIQTLDYEHPGAKVSTWELENNIFVATFKEDGSIGKIYISNSGKWLKTTYSIPKTELPSAITEYIKNKYQFYTISVALLQETPDEKMHYYIEAKPDGMGMQSSILTFNEVGALIKRTDPEGFVDSKKEAENKAETPAQKQSASKTASTPSSKETPQKTGAKATDKTEPAQASNKTTSKPDTKPTTTSKPTTTTSTSKPTTTTSTSKPTTTTTSKPATTTSTSKPATTTTTTSKPATTTTTTSKPTTKTSEPQKEEKTKKGKDTKPIVDEQGNSAISQTEVPPAVVTALTKKVQRPEDLNWYKIDTFYVAKCIAKMQKNDIYFTSQGVWEKTLINLPEESVTGNIQKHLDAFYRGWKFKQATKELHADKQDITIVEIYEKENWKSKMFTTVIFDKTGKLIRSIDPTYSLDGRNNVAKEDNDLNEYYAKMDMSIDNNNTDKIPPEIINAFKAKYPRITNAQWSQDDDGNYLATYLGARGKEICVIGQSATILQTQMSGNIETLPESINNYVKEKHKGFKVKEYYAVKDLMEKRNTYKVIINNKKTGAEETLWFTTAGIIIE